MVYLWSSRKAAGDTESSEKASNAEAGKQTEPALFTDAAQERETCSATDPEAEDEAPAEDTADAATQGNAEDAAAADKSQSLLAKQTRERAEELARQTREQAKMMGTSMSNWWSSVKIPTVPQATSQGDRTLFKGLSWRRGSKADSITADAEETKDTNEQGQECEDSTDAAAAEPDPSDEAGIKSDGTPSMETVDQSQP